MKQLKRPEHVRVMGRDYLIVYEDSSVLGTDNLGRCHNNACVIGIQEGQHPIEEADTILHEILHAIWYCMSISEGGADEESVVRRMASGQLQVYMDNPHLLAYFTSLQKSITKVPKHEAVGDKRRVSGSHGNRSGRGQCCTGELPKGK